MRPFRRNSSLKGPEATEIIPQLSDPRLKDSAQRPDEKRRFEGSRVQRLPRPAHLTAVET